MFAYSSLPVVLGNEVLDARLSHLILRTCALFQCVFSAIVRALVDSSLLLASATPIRVHLSVIRELIIIRTATLSLGAGNAYTICLSLSFTMHFYLLDIIENLWAQSERILGD